MQNKYGLAKAIKLASMSMVMGVALLPFSASYAEEAMATDEAMAAEEAMAADENENVEEVFVTGSRLARTNLDTGSQLVTMDRTDIDALGTLTIADTLRSSPLNSLGSFSERSGSSAQSNATVDLRGIGSERSLVMINGRRMVGSPNLGASSININMIPMSAVERLDVMADGGSAVYGSDAVAGVVNLQMRDNYDGTEIKISKGDRANDDGTENSFSFITGVTSDTGNITFAVEKSSRDAIFDADRSYTSAWARDTDGDGIIEAYVDTDGYSIYGQSIAIYDPTTGYDDIQAGNSCQSDQPWLGSVDASTDWAVPGATYCMYGYANASANKAALDKTSTYLSFNRKLSQGTELFGTALVSKVESFGRFAPPAAAWENMPEDYADVPFDIAALLASGDITVDPITGEPNYEITGYYRWTNIGPRDNLVTDTQTDFVFGLRGDINDDVNYEVYAQQSIYDVKELGYYYLSYPGLEYVLSQGIDPFSAEGAGAMSATTTQDNFAKMDKFYGQVTFGLGDVFGAGDVNALVGVESIKMSYQNKYDRASENGFVGGSAGNSSDGTRDINAIFGEANLPVADDIELNAAVRYDNYSDFGSAVSPSLSGTWAVSDDLTVRARVSQGFRAPGLDQLYGPETFSAEQATDYSKCANATPVVAAADCPAGQVDTYYRTNDELDAETSSTFSIGANWEFVQDWSVDAGFWMVGITDTIIQSTTQDVLNAEAAGIAMTSADVTYVDRTVAKPKVYSSYTNAGDMNVSGLDIKLAGLTDTALGQFTFNGLVTKQLSYEEAAYYQGPTQDKTGFYLYPEIKAQLVLGWNAGGHSVNYVVDYIGEHASATSINTDTLLLDSSSEKLESWTTMNVSYGYKSDDFGTIKIGARNLTNEDPVLDKNGKFDSDLYDLYDATGRVVYSEYSIEF